LQWEAGLKFICEKTGYELRDGRKEALEKLYRGDDVVLVAMTRDGKTLIYTGFHAFFPISARAITLVISPLLAIEQDQAEEIWVSAEIVLGDLLVEGRSSANKADLQ